MIRSRNLPVEVDDDTLALDTIDAVGPGGNYLLEPHTFAHCRDYERPTFFNRRRHDVWVSRGGSDLACAARRHLQTVVESWEEPEMDPTVRRRLGEYCLG
jgi:trimethylamine---corrinoid protein Co-methyltransferase